MCAVLFCLFLGGIFTYMISWGNNEVFIEDNLFWLYAPVIVLSALFAADFLGAEYSQGAMRNKLIIGHKRLDIYLADLTTTVTGSLIFNAATMLPWVFIGKRAVIGCSAEEFAARIVTSFCAAAACSSIFTLLILTIARPRAGTAAALIAAMFLLFAPANNYTDPSPAEKVMMSVIPSCQLKKLSLADVRYDPELDGLITMPFYSLGMIAVSSVVGAIVFSRKNIT